MIFEKSIIIIIIVQKTTTKRSARDTNTTTYRIFERRQNFDADDDDADVPELRRLRSSLSSKF
jgi:hypothetical protein